jgi:mono/diheme cytochrome c family protein
MLPTLITAALTVLPISAFPNTQIEPSEFTAESGEKLWNQTQTVSGQARSCASCHTSDPRKAGKHVRTGKPIKPMASSANSDRFADPKKVAKWFKRNCKWTLGRECNEQEKGDLTRYLKSI